MAPGDRDPIGGVARSRAECFAGSTIEDVPRGCGPFRFTYTSQDYGANDHQADALGTRKEAIIRFDKKRG